MKKNNDIHHLLAEHAALYREFLPTLEKYQSMAKRALDLQVRILAVGLHEAFPDAEFNEAPLILTLSARETPAKVDGIIKELSNQKITVTRVIYCPQTFSYHLYGK